MDHFVLLLLGGTIMVLFLNVSWAQTCAKAHVDECLSDLKRFASDNGHESAVIVKNEQELTTLCWHAEEAHQCIGTFLSSCSDIEQAVWGGVYDGYKYLCNETSSEFLDHNSCMSQHNNTLAAKYENCTATYVSRVSEDITQDLCLHTQNLINCTDTAVVASCGEEAGQWQTQFLIRTLQPLYTILDCDLSDLITNKVTTKDSGSTRSPSAQSSPTPSHASSTWAGYTNSPTAARPKEHTTSLVPAGKQELAQNKCGISTAAVVIIIILVLICVALAAAFILYYRSQQNSRPRFQSLYHDSQAELFSN